jgi:hypothetical protein
VRQIKFGNLNIFIKKSNMVQPKYSPEEALQRVKLMMGYDTKKTLKENNEIIFEQYKEAAIGGGLGASTGAAYAAATAVPASSGALMALPSGASAIIPGVASALGVGTVAATAVVAGVAGAALLPLAYWFLDKDDAKPKVARMMEYCKTDSAKIAKIARGNSDAEIRNLSDQLADAMNYTWGTDEESVYKAFRSLKGASDFCALVDRFNKDYGSDGDLLEWLDGDFDLSSQWEQIYRPIRDVVEDSLLSLKDETVVTDTNRQSKINALYCSVKNGVIDNVVSEYNGIKWDDYVTKNSVKPEEIEIAKKSCGGKKTGGGGGYKPCSGTYSYGCKSDVIAKVQGCLGGLSQDGKFGPKTKAKLSAKGFTTFTDADVEKICSEVETKLTSDVESSDLSGEENVALTSGGQSVDPNTKDGIS